MATRDGSGCYGNKLCGMSERYFVVQQLVRWRYKPEHIKRLWISTSPEQFLDKQGPRTIPINVWGKIGQIWVILVPEVVDRTDKMACWASLIQVQTREFARMWRSGPWSDKAPWPSRKFLTSCGSCGSPWIRSLRFKSGPWQIPVC